MAWADARKNGWPLSNPEFDTPSECWKHYRQPQQAEWKTLEFGELDKFDDFCRRSEGWRGKNSPLEATTWTKEYRSPSMEQNPVASSSKINAVYPQSPVEELEFPPAGVSEVALSDTEFFDNWTIPPTPPSAKPFTAPTSNPDPKGKRKAIEMDDEQERLDGAKSSFLSPLDGVRPRDIHPVHRSPRGHATTPIHSPLTPPFTPAKPSPLSQVTSAMIDELPALDVNGATASSYDEIESTFFANMDSALASISWESMFEDMASFGELGDFQYDVKALATPPPDELLPDRLTKRRRLPPPPPSTSSGASTSETEISDVLSTDSIPSWMSRDSSRSDLIELRSSGIVAGPITADVTQIRDEQVSTRCPLPAQGLTFSQPSFQFGKTSMGGQLKAAPFEFNVWWELLNYAANATPTQPLVEDPEA
jgi:hypothetical protein